MCEGSFDMKIPFWKSISVSSKVTESEVRELPKLPFFPLELGWFWHTIFPILKILYGKPISLKLDILWQKQRIILIEDMEQNPGRLSSVAILEK